MLLVILAICIVIAIIFREEIRFAIGFGVLALICYWVTSSWTGSVLIAGILVLAGYWGNRLEKREKKKKEEDQQQQIQRYLELKEQEQMNESINNTLPKDVSDEQPTYYTPLKPRESVSEQHRKGYVVRDYRVGRDSDTKRDETN